MSEVIKQIEEAEKYLRTHQWTTYGEGVLSVYQKHHNRHTLFAAAALSVLKRIASGEDWQPIGDCDPLDTPVLLKLKSGNQTIGAKGGCMYAYWYSLKVDLDAETEMGDGYLTDGSFDIDNPPTHWKPIDGEKHVQMLMDEEMKG